MDHLRGHSLGPKAGRFHDQTTTTFSSLEKPRLRSPAKRKKIAQGSEKTAPFLHTQHYSLNELQISEPAIMKLIVNILLIIAFAAVNAVDDGDCVGLQNSACKATDGCAWEQGSCVEEHHSELDTCASRANNACEDDDTCMFVKGNCIEVNRGSGVQGDSCVATFEKSNPNSDEYITAEVEGSGCSAGYGCVVEETDVVVTGLNMTGTCQPTSCFGKKVPGNCNGGNNDQCSEATIRVTICHRTCSETNPWVRITIDDDAWDDNKDDTCGHQQHTIDPTCNGKDLSKWGVNKSDYLIKRHGTRAEIAASVPNDKAYWRQWERACPYVLNGKCCSWDAEDDNLCCGEPPSLEEETVETPQTEAPVPQTATSPPTTAPVAAPTEPPIPETSTAPPTASPVAAPTEAPIPETSTPPPTDPEVVVDPPPPNTCPPELYAVNGVQLADGDLGSFASDAEYPVTVISGTGTTVTFQVCATTGTAYTGFLEEVNGDYVCYETDANTGCTEYTAQCFVNEPISVVDIHLLTPIAGDEATTPVPQCCHDEAADPLSAAYVFVLRCDCL